ncbi:MAG: segregation/condensation protein A [Nanoarchaeota archaeon]
MKSFFISALKDKLTFSKLLPSESKEDKVHTFIPLLHLAQQSKIELVQDIPFGEIQILLKKKEEESKVEEKSEVVEG